MLLALMEPDQLEPGRRLPTAQVIVRLLISYLQAVAVQDYLV